MSFKNTDVGLIPIEWNLKTVTEYSEIVTDYVANGSFASLKENVEYLSTPDYAVLIRLTDFNKNFNGDFVYLSKHSYEFLSKTKLDGGEIIISNVGANVGTVFKAPKLNFRMTLGPNSIMIKSKGIDTFYYYWFLSPNGQQSIKSILSGSAQPKFNKTSFRKLKLPVPPINEQKGIANILSTLDEKIEVNNQITTTLENMAQELFKRWFVDFEFPNEEGEPYQRSGGQMVESELGMIPKQWEVKEFSNLAENVSGYSYKGKDLQESNDALITIKNFDRNGGFKIDGFKNIKISERVKEKHYAELLDIIVAHTDLTQNADIIGNPIMIMNKVNNNNLIFSMDTVKVIPKSKESRYYVYQLLKQSDFKNFALAHTSGTTVLHLSKKAIPNYKYSASPQSLIKKYNSIVGPLFEKILLIYKENMELKNIRDTLLPKLMSGEIRVPLEELEESLTEVKGG